MISTAIIHCPRSVDRRENLRLLLDQLPDASVIEDSGNGDAIGKRLHRRGCWPIARRAWLAASESGAHHLVLEDDAVLCDDFSLHLRRAIEVSPSACLSLFSGARDCSVATVMPASLVRRWIDWVDSSDRGSRFLPHHDWLISEGMRQLAVPHFAAAPSLVQHGRFDSLLDHPHVSATRFERNPTEVALVPRL